MQELGWRLDLGTKRVWLLSNEVFLTAKFSVVQRVGGHCGCSWGGGSLCGGWMMNVNANEQWARVAGGFWREDNS